MAEQPAAQPGAKAQVLNDRTYQEVEYLKKNLGPILVAALAEICIRRPADPIEYLGHWLLRWRYNEELKRRDVQNALEVVRQKAWSKDDGSMQPMEMAQTLTPGGQAAQGPMSAAVIEQPMGGASAPPTIESGGEKRVSGEARRPSAEEKRASVEEKRVASAGGEEKRGSAGGAGSGEIKRASGEAQPAEESRRASADAPRGSADAKRPSEAQGEIAEEGKRPSRKSGAAAIEVPPPSAEGEPAPEGDAPPPSAEPEPAPEGDAPPPE